MMLGGRDAFIDDLFVRQGFRDRAIGSAAVAGLCDEAAAAEIQAIHLLVADTNPRAAALYRRLGFTALPHRMMTRRVPIGGSATAD